MGYLLAPSGRMGINRQEQHKQEPALRALLCPWPLTFVCLLPSHLPAPPPENRLAPRSIWWNIKLISAPRRPKRKVRIFLTGAMQHAISNTSKGPVTRMCWDLRYGSEVYTMYFVILFPWKKILGHIQLPFRPYWASRARPTSPR